VVRVVLADAPRVFPEGAALAFPQLETADRTFKMRGRRLKDADCDAIGQTIEKNATGRTIALFSFAVRSKPYPQLCI